ncbi:MAG: LacI family DNA-binding transcriptional regulator [Lentisphaeria bacterium]|nr:LacI family DNA-binding transcriptional regulator [Lentisphaeria bacterium]
MNITAKQIAEMVNVSKQAVYSVLSNKPKCLVSPEKKEKILFLAKAYHYKPNTAAVSLNGKSTFQVGAVVDSFASIEGRIASYLASKLEIENYTLKVAKITSIKQGYEMIHNFISSGADAVVFSGRRFPDINYGDYRVPLLGIDREFGFDYYGGSKKITDHLIKEHGYTKILHIASEAGPYPKYLGYCDAMKDAGLKALPVLHTIMNPDFNDSLKKYLDQGVNAFVTSGDNTAALLIYYLRTLGLKVPEDAAVTGFDHFCSFPEITTVSFNIDETARTGCRMLLEKIRSKNLAPVAPQFTVPELKPAASCGCPPVIFDHIAEFYSEDGLISRLQP